MPMRFIVLKENSLKGVVEAARLAVNTIQLNFKNPDVLFYVPDWFYALASSEMDINPYLWHKEGKYPDMCGCRVFPGYENDIVAVNIADPKKYSIRIKIK